MTHKGKNESQGRGIGGWLAIYLILGLFSAVSYLSKALQAFIFQSSPMLPLYFEIAHFLLAFFNGFTCIWLLLKKPKAVEFVKNYLIVAAVYFGVMMVLLVARTGLSELALSYVFGVLVNIIWYQYFDKSKRIQETYV